MITWSRAFRKLLWMPITLLVIFLIGFVYDAKHDGISLMLVRIYLTMFLSYIALFYVGGALYLRYTLRFGIYLLFFIFGLFAICSIKNNFIVDVLSSYVQTHVNLDFFIGSLTVAALLITVLQVQEQKKSGLNFSSTLDTPKKAKKSNKKKRR
jgi:hypothetical protein